MPAYEIKRNSCFQKIQGGCQHEKDSAFLMVFLVACSSTPKIDDSQISSQIQNYHDNDLKINVDEFMGLDILPLPAKNFFQVSDLVIVDKSISGDEATVIAHLKYTMLDVPPMESASGKALAKYFGSYDFLNQTFEQERKFLFRQYESGTWRFEKELITD